ncbi:hypothetical protein FGIG_01487 [Fasciola gigantica]|uniref:Uncharacterized protein n=1 Tax=Fasciola gigantica TaxID=46835 RepID=A0A504YKQ9_FASGI|nr:hypothetical protein FGIG_01487 [Fasciola gigantica]
MSSKAECYVKRWMHNAQPTERELATEFFAQFRKQPTNNEENGKRFAELLEYIKGKQAFTMPRNPVFSYGDGSTQLKRLDLLSPAQRRDLWMYQSWHHLPPYLINKEAAERDCRGSHYNRPHRHIAPDYVIHPDME